MRGKPTDRILSLTILRFEDQNGKCYYCLRQTWVPAIHRREYAINRLGIKERLLSDLRATAEHLRKREDGGTDDPRNIVMACNECNRERGWRNPLEHVRVQRQIFQASRSAVAA